MPAEAGGPTSVLLRGARLLEVLVDLSLVLRGEVVEVAVDELLAQLLREVAPDLVQVDVRDLLGARTVLALARVLAARIALASGVVLGAVLLVVLRRLAVLRLLRGVRV